MIDNTKKSASAREYKRLTRRKHKSRVEGADLRHGDGVTMMCGGQTDLGQGRAMVVEVLTYAIGSPAWAHRGLRVQKPPSKATPTSSRLPRALLSSCCCWGLDGKTCDNVWRHGRSRRNRWRPGHRGVMPDIWNSEIR